MNRIGLFFIVAGVVVTATAFHDIYNEPESTTATTATVHDSQTAITTDAEETVGDKNAVIMEGSITQSPPTKFVSTQSTAGKSIAPETVAKWIVATNSQDQGERELALEALATSPREKILPELRKLAANGSTNDRELTLNALHNIAIKKGDDDGEIRNILRLISYDGDDALASNAQVTLDDIENIDDENVVR